LSADTTKGCQAALVRFPAMMPIYGRKYTPIAGWITLSNWPVAG
jgi:hypothetical protein